MFDGRMIWTDALRSGQYPQGRSKLGDATTGYCCLGLACKLAVDAGIIGSYSASHVDLGEYPAVQAWIGIDTYVGEYEGSSLARDNDNGVSFTDIADIIDEEF